MSRTQDLTHVDGRLKEIETKLQAIASEYDRYNNEISATIKEVMVEAGVWDEVHSLEMERREEKDKAQAKANALVGEKNELVAVRNFLVAREKTQGGDAAPSGAVPVGDVTAPDTAIQTKAAGEESSEDESSEDEPSEENVLPMQGRGNGKTKDEESASSKVPSDKSKKADRPRPSKPRI